MREKKLSSFKNKDFPPQIFAISFPKKQFDFVFYPQRWTWVWCFPNIWSWCFFHLFFLVKMLSLRLYPHIFTCNCTSICKIKTNLKNHLTDTQHPAASKNKLNLYSTCHKTVWTILLGENKPVSTYWLLYRICIQLLENLASWEPRFYSWLLLPESFEQPTVIFHLCVFFSSSTK